MKTPTRIRIPGLSALALVLLAFLAALSPAAAAARDPYAAALARIDNALRFAIERQPEGLAKSLAASERVCALGEDAEVAGEAAAAAEDWGALGQIVARLDEPGLVRVEAAFASVDATLQATVKRFSRTWRKRPQRVAELRRGAREVRRGLGRLDAGFGRLAGAFAAWREHRCEAALAAVDGFSAAIPAAMSAVNFGMWRLYSLSAGARRGAARAPAARAL